MIEVILGVIGIGICVMLNLMLLAWFFRSLYYWLKMDESLYTPDAWKTKRSPQEFVGQVACVAFSAGCFVGSGWLTQWMVTWAFFR